MPELGGEVSGFMGCSANWKSALCVSTPPPAQPLGPPPSAEKASGIPGGSPLSAGSGPTSPPLVGFCSLSSSSTPAARVPQWPGLPPRPFIEAARNFQTPLRAYRRTPLVRLRLDAGSLLHAPFGATLPRPGHASRSPCAAGTVSAARLEGGPRCTSPSLRAKVYSRSDHTASFTAQEDEGREEPQAFDSCAALGWRCPGVRGAGCADTGPPGRWPRSDLCRLRPGPHYCSHVSPDSSLQPPKGSQRPGTSLSGAWVSYFIVPGLVSSPVKCQILQTPSSAQVPHAEASPPQHTASS